MKAGSRRAAAPGVEVPQLDDDAQTELRNKNIGFVFQSFHLLPRLTAEENVMVPLLYRGVSEKEAREKAENALCIPLNAVTSSKGESKVNREEKCRAALAETADRRTGSNKRKAGNPPHGGESSQARGSDRRRCKNVCAAFPIVI